MDHHSVDQDAIKDKLRSFSTLNTLYHETRQEIEALKREICKRDAAITDLRARLARYERVYINVDHLLQEDGGEEDKENQGGGECSPSVLVGPSRSLLESLCKEICKLKQRRNEAEVRAARQAEASQQEIQRLHAQLGEKERELEAVRCQPDHQKDQEIQRLRSALEDRDRVQATRAVLCSSLAEEADQLRRQLDATVRVCQELLGRLENKDGKSGAITEEMPRQQESKEMTESPDVVANAQIRQLEQENQQLKQRVAYVEGLNSKWQKYDSSREEYVRGLCQRLKESGGLQAGVSSSSSDPQGPVRAVLGSPALLHQEIARLNGLLEEKMREATRMSRDLEDVRRRDRERIQTLEQQVLIYTEDFKSERADRERAQGRVNDLKEEISRLQQLHKQGAGGRDHRDSAPVCRVHIGHRISSRRHNKESAEQFQRSPAADPARRQGGITSGAGGRSAAPAAMAMVPRTGTGTGPNWTECRGLSELQCPRCLATFDENDAAEYLNHCEECAKL